MQAEEAEELAAALRAAQSTPKGSKKDTTHPMLKGYDPPVVEAAWCVHTAALHTVYAQSAHRPLTAQCVRSMARQTAPVPLSWLSQTIP
jgi:hypothetical protein